MSVIRRPATAAEAEALLEAVVDMLLSLQRRDERDLCHKIYDRQLDRPPRVSNINSGGTLEDGLP